MLKKFADVIPFITGALLTLLVVGQLAFKNRTDDLHNTKTVYKWESPALPDTLSFAGEKVPLERWEVKEKLDRELLFNYYNQANVIFLLKLASRYFAPLSERLKANGVPDDFKYLCVAESNLLSNAYSRVGAVGFWQFMNYTGPGYNLEINDQVDERYDLDKSTDAACKYLKQAYAKFGNWTAAAASYNCGQGGYSTQATYQQTFNYYDLQLPEETNRYLFRILAFKQLLEHAKDYGFDLREEDKYHAIPFRTITVTTDIPNLAQFAISNGTTYKMLRLLNPWLRGKLLTVKPGASYTIKLPQP